MTNQSIKEKKADDGPKYETREMFVGATPKKSMPEKGWVEGQMEGIYIQEMSTGSFCIFKSSGVHVKSGYAVYPSIEAMQEDFQLHRGKKDFKVSGK